MTNDEKKIIKSLPCDFHYKKNIKKFMKFYDLNLSDSLDYIFDVFFVELNEKVRLNELNDDFDKTPRCSFSLEHHLSKAF